MSIRRPLLAIALVLGLAAAFGEARAELTPWDQAKVTALSKQLVEDAQNMQDVFQKKPPPTIGSGDSRDYYQLKQLVRRIRQEATALSGDLEGGAGKDATHNSYESLMETVRDAREVAGRVFATQDMKDAATAVRTVLNQLSPYYDPNAEKLEPVTR